MFHLSVPVSDLEATREFYGAILGCPESKLRDDRVDFRFFGHHLVTHVVASDDAELHRRAGGGGNLAVRHFGVWLEWDDWEVLRDRLEELAISFVVPPEVRGAGSELEEALMFIQDPSGNGVEFKSARNPELWLGFELATSRSH